MFSPTTAQQFNTEIYRIISSSILKYIGSYSTPPTCFEIFWPSSGRYSTKKKKHVTLANYDFVLFFFFVKYLPHDG